MAITVYRSELLTTKVTSLNFILCLGHPLEGSVADQDVLGSIPRSNNVIVIFYVKKSH